MDDNRLAWYLPDQLRWLDENRTAGYMPCGQLVGVTLNQCADTMERLAAENRKLRAERLKLDKRIHRQRLALRENWEIVEQRATGIRRFNLHFLNRFSKYLDEIGIPRDGWTIWKRLEMARATPAGLNGD